MVLDDISDNFLTILKSVIMAYIFWCPLYMVIIDINCLFESFCSFYLHVHVPAVLAPRDSRHEMQSRPRIFHDQQ